MYTQTRSRVLGDDSMVSIVLKNLQLFSQTHNIIVIWVNTLCKMYLFELLLNDISFLHFFNKAYFDQLINISHLCNFLYFNFTSLLD